MAADITDGDVATVEGQTVALSTADVVGRNVVIHLIDAVILPPGVDTGPPQIWRRVIFCGTGLLRYHSETVTPFQNA